LVITSTDDQVIAPELSESMAAAIRDADLAIIEGAGHLSSMERPDEFSGLLRRHLDRSRLTG
jgi:pimeloyl-ACP methyl ester carboxylesterase